MIGPVLQFEDLQQICAPGKRPRLSTVEDWLRRCNIRFHYDGRGGVWTTTAALDAALGVGAAANDIGRMYDPSEIA